MKDYAKIGFFSGFDVFLSNIMYSLLVVRIINRVSNQGIYWQANDIIWGFLLIPVMVHQEIIKKQFGFKIKDLMYRVLLGCLVEV